LDNRNLLVILFSKDKGGQIGQKEVIHAALAIVPLQGLARLAEQPFETIWTEQRRQGFRGHKLSK